MGEPPAPNGSSAALYLRAADMQLLDALPEASAIVSEELGRHVRLKAIDLAADAHGNSRALHINLSCDDFDPYSTAYYFAPMVMFAARLFEGGKVVRSSEKIAWSRNVAVPDGEWYDVAQSSKAVWPLGPSASSEISNSRLGNYGLVYARPVQKTLEGRPFRMEIRWFGRGFGDRLTALTVDWLHLALDYTEEMVRQGRQHELHSVANPWSEWRRLNGVERDVSMQLRYQNKDYVCSVRHYNAVLRRNIETVLTITPERQDILDKWDALTEAIEAGTTYGVTSAGSLEGALQRYERRRMAKLKGPLTYEEAIHFESFLRTVTTDPKQLQLVDAALGGIISRNQMFDNARIADAVAQPIAGTPGADIALLVNHFFAHPNAKNLVLGWATFGVKSGSNCSLHVRIDHGLSRELMRVLEAVAGTTTIGIPKSVRDFARDNLGYVHARYDGNRVPMSNFGVSRN